MKQILQSYRSGELWLADVPAPLAVDNRLLVQTSASLLSAGTERMLVELANKSLLGKAMARPDLVKKMLRKVKTEGLSSALNKTFSKLDTPISLGYSCAGVVLESGMGASGFRPGDRVACGGAGYATHAEFNSVPKNLCARIPDGVSFEDAAFTTVGTIALQGVRQANVRVGDRVAVIGLGLLGLLTVQILRASGCRVLGMDPDPGRRERAAALGADVVDAAGLTDAALAFSDGHGVDSVLITAATSSNEPVIAAAEIVRRKGCVVVVGMVGMDLPRDPFYKKELDLRLSMSYGPGRYDTSYEEGGQDYPFAYVRWTEQRNMEAFLQLVADGQVTPARLVTHRFSIDDALGAYEMLEGKGDHAGESYLGIVIEYPGPVGAKEPDRRIEVRGIEGARLGLGLIGAGGFARGVLLPLLQARDDIELVGVCTATGMSGKTTAEKFGFAYATTDPGALLGDDRMGAVIIATRHDSHARLACEALRAGRHVLVEKPLALHAEELDEIEAVLETLPAEGGPLLMVGYNRRFSPHARAVRDAFASRRSPMTVSYRVSAGTVPSDSWLHHPEQGGGRLIGEGCHFLDLCGYLAGCDAVRVYADCISSDDNEIVAEDTAAITLRYADGSLAVVTVVAQGSPGINKERIEVFADTMTAVIEDFSRTIFHGGGGKTVGGRQDKGIAAELDAFVSAAISGGAPPMGHDALLRTSRLVLAARDSLRRGAAIAL